MTDTDTAYDAAIAYAAAQGTEDGLAAAGWYFDGNTSQDTYAAVLLGLDDGDPAVLDTLPYPDLSGQWADSLTGPALFEAALDSASQYGTHHIGHVAGDADCEMHDWFTPVCDAYELAFSDAAQDEIERVARLQTGGAA